MLPTLNRQESRRRLGHLHQREQRFLHARPTRGREAHQRYVLLQRQGRRTHELLADHGAHRAAHESELEGHCHYWQAIQRAAHGQQGIFLAGGSLRRRQAILVLLRVAKLEAVDRWQVAGEFLTAFGIDPDFFSLDDLLHLHRARYTAQRVVDLALSKSREGARA